MVWECVGSPRFAGATGKKGIKKPSFRQAERGLNGCVEVLINTSIMMFWFIKKTTQAYLF